jgi:hypothetical protein
MNNTPAPVKYFEVLRALHKGGLSLWLNRKTLLPMTLIPTIATFLTLMMSRIDGLQEASAFQLALIQIPADFIIGIFCSLIVFIILNAPKKKDKDAPVHFQLNILGRKDLLIGGALAYMVFGYLIAGAYGVMGMIFEPIQQAASEQKPANVGMIIPIILMMLGVFYVMRFALLPILIIAEIDVVSFFKTFKSFGLSAPVFSVKVATTLAVGLVLYVPLQGLLGGTGDETTGVPATMALVDFGFAFGAVIAAAWGSAALAIGYRQMMEGTEST